MDAEIEEKKLVWSKNLRNLPSIKHEDIDKWAESGCKIPKSKQKKGYSNFIEGYVHNVQVREADEKNGQLKVDVKCQSYPSMRKNVPKYNVQISLKKNQVICNNHCDCKAGNGRCSHVIGLLYTLVHYQKCGYRTVPPLVSKTSLPQTWHIPRRNFGITPHRVDTLKISKVKPQSVSQSQTPSKKRKVSDSIFSTLYCPVNPIPYDSFLKTLQQNLTSVNSDSQILKLLKIQTPNIVNSKYGPVPFGCPVSYQQKEDQQDSEKNIIVNDTVKFFNFHNFPLPSQPATYSYVLSRDCQSYFDGIQLSNDTAKSIEEETSEQSNSPLWHELRVNRLTSSQFKHICCRQKDFTSLATRLFSGKKIQTSAMKYGICNEPLAAKKYVESTGNNVYLCGLVINPKSPYLGTSPDRKVYDPVARDFELLEIKSPILDSFTQCKYMKQTENGFVLKRSHEYYYQVIGQLGITGFQWCDLMVCAKEDFHIERIKFDITVWENMKEKLDIFYFEHYMPLIVQKSL